jgi:hypothetical protein
MPAAARLASRSAPLKTALLALLVANTAYYLVAATWSRGLDALAWLALLVLFELETGGSLPVRNRPAFSFLRLLRLAAAVAVCAATVAYWYEDATLDAINAVLWIAVVVLLEAEVRLQGAVARHRTAFGVVAAIVYSSLALLIPLWATRGEWFDSYDALLWLVAFATIEMNILKIEYRGARTEG